MLVNPMLAEWKEKYSPNTVHARRGVLRRLLQMLEEFGAPKNVSALPKAKRPQSRTRIATPQEIAKLLKNAPTWQRLFCLLAWQMGLRFAECFRVTPRSHDRVNHTITIQRKGGRVSTLPTTPDVEQLLDAAGDTEGKDDLAYILIHKGTNHHTIKGIRCHWYRLCKNAGVQGLTPHDLRRTVLTALYAVTKDLRATQQFAGHESLASTTAYLAPLTEDQLRDYHRLLNFHSEVKQ
jgi:integrase